jgi:solute carrier family 35 protein E1
MCDRGGAGSSIMLAVYLLLWYAFNVIYNIYNKTVLNVFPFPWTVATLQLGIGLLYVFPVWLLRYAL